MITTGSTLRARLGSAEAHQARVLTPREFHIAIGGVVGINRIYELLRSNRLRHVRIGSRYLILSSEVDDFFAREAAMGLA